MNSQDFEYLSSNLDTEKLFGSDTAIANLFLLQQKYNTELKIHKNILFRYYYGSENRTGYGFPLPMKNAAADWLKSALEYIFQNAKEEKRPVTFCLLTQEQKNQIDLCLAANFPNQKIDWKTNRDDCDYLYRRENLANLPGSSYQKKRNHVSRFNRTYGENWYFKSYPENDIAQDILSVSKKWFDEKNAEDDHVLVLEQKSIALALKNTRLLNLRGGVLYINGEPAAMTLAAPISSDVLDVIYEKAVSEHEKNGAYPVINQQFAKLCSDFLFFNREEDMGIEGLRKAKLSYKPTMILDKFYGKVI